MLICCGNIMNIKSLKKKSVSQLVGLYEKKDIEGVIPEDGINESPRTLDIDVLLNDSLNLDKALSIQDNLSMSIGVDTVLARRVKDRIRYEIQLPKQLWKSYSMSDLKLPLQIGVTNGNKPVTYDANKNATLIAGSPGSGKSVTLRVILFQLMRQFTPEQLKIGLVDTHSSIKEFNDSAHMLSLPAISPSEVESLFQRFESELRYRKNLGEAECKRLKLPIYLLAIDEASDLNVLGMGKKNHVENLNISQALIKEGRKFGIYVIISTQKPSETDLPGVFGLITNRYVGLVANASMSNLLGGQGQLNAHKLSGNGDFFHVSGNDITRFVVAMPKEQEYSLLPKSTLLSIQEVSQERIVVSEPKQHMGRPRSKIDAKILAQHLLGDKSDDRYVAFSREVLHYLKKFGGNITNGN